MEGKVSPYISTRLHPKLLIASIPTIRIWIYLVIMMEKSGSFLTTATAIAEGMSRYKQTSARAASRALSELEGLGMISLRC